MIGYLLNSLKSWHTVKSPHFIDRNLLGQLETLKARFTI